MSVRISEDIWEYTEHGGTELLVLLKLADNADEETAIAYPSVDYLAKRCRVSRRSIQYTLRKLEASGAIELAEPATRHTTARYYVGRKYCAPESLGAQPETTRGATERHLGAQPVAPEPSLEPSEEPSGGARRARLLNDRDDQRAKNFLHWFIGVLTEQRGGSTPRPTASWEDAARKIVSGRDGEEIRRVVLWGLSRPYWASRISTPAKLAQKFPELRLEWAAAEKLEQTRNGHDPEREAAIAASYRQKYT